MVLDFRCLVALPVYAEDFWMLRGLALDEAYGWHGYDGWTVLLYGYRGRPATRNPFVQYAVGWKFRHSVGQMLRALGGGYFNVLNLIFLDFIVINHKFKFNFT